MHGAKKTAVHQFTEEEMIAEGRLPIPEDRKEKPPQKGIVDFDRYTPWYMREEMTLQRLAHTLRVSADTLARAKRYDELIELRWLNNSEQKALSDGRTNCRIRN